MPIGYFKSVPKVSIEFERDSYRPGDELRVRVTVHSARPGTTVRRAVVDLVIENRYTSTSTVSVARATGVGGTGQHMSQTGRVSITKTDRRVTEERVDRTIIGRERLFTDGVIRRRNEIFDLRFEIKRPSTRRTTQRDWLYQLSVHFDLPRMRDVEIHRTVPVQLD